MAKKRKKEGDILINKNQLVNQVDGLKKMVRILASIVTVLFGWLKFKDVSFYWLTNQITVDLILKITIIIYYFSWFFGSLLDFSDAGKVLHSTKNDGKTPFMGVVLAISIAISFIILCFYYDKSYFPILLTLFWFYDLLVLNLYSKIVIHPYFHFNKESVNKFGNYLMLMEIEIAENFWYGKWNNYRYITGFVILFVALIFNYTNWPNLFINDNLNNKFYVAILLLLFVITIEVWIWYFRLKKYFGLKILFEIQKNQTLS